MKKFKVWRAVYRDMGHESGVVVRADDPNEAIKLANAVMKREEKFNPDAFIGIELLTVVWEDK